MGIFGKIGSTKAAVGGNYLQPGRYIARIERVKRDTSAKDGKVFVAIELAVLNTLADGRPDLNGKPVAANQPGDTPTHLMMVDKLSFLGNFKAFIMKAMNVTEAEITEGDCEEAVSDSNPLGGRLVEIDANIIKTRTGGPFTRTNYVRNVPLVEAADAIHPKALALFYPGTSLDEALSAEAA